MKIPEIHAVLHEDREIHADPQTFKFKKMLISKHLNFQRALTINITNMMMRPWWWLLQT
jgi:hypothetical protein